MDREAKVGDFVCGYCDRSFSTREALQKHLAGCKNNPDGIGDKVYECGKCGATFTEIEAAREHRRNCVGTGGAAGKPK